MIISPKTRGFICTTAHPEGCLAMAQKDALYAKEHPIPNGPKNVLVLGSSTGYGLAGRLAAAFGCNANTLGVFFERPATQRRTATAGWYNTAAFEVLTQEMPQIHHHINGDAFSQDVKEKTIQAIRDLLPGGKVDFILYSLAAPRRTDPITGETYQSVLKPIGSSFQDKTVDFHTGEVSTVNIEPATKEEVQETVKVMGGEDWKLWITALQEADVVAENAATVALSYLGPELTHAIYKNGTIGKAKEDLEEKAKEIDTLLAPLGGKAFVSVNKALVTQSSSAIPVVPLYISLLFQVMKNEGTHEGSIQQMIRMFQRMYPSDSLTSWENIPTDRAGRLRLDDWEMSPAVQTEVLRLWDQVSSDTIYDLSDLDGYRKDFFQLFGFEIPTIDYSKESDPLRELTFLLD